VENATSTEVPARLISVSMALCLWVRRIPYRSFACHHFFIQTGTHNFQISDSAELFDKDHVRKRKKGYSTSSRLFFRQVSIAEIHSERLPLSKKFEMYLWDSVGLAVFQLAARE
jgi:hypothetical protein